ncbi:hypothetical protein AURDEDRAFT_158421 [Auricularia subglabra TFB-10046 SS5]|nr:hypothetical protein AURDEDRAFT_158421 [Auricularia subglabra TFB-10046 SS5]
MDVDWSTSGATNHLHPEPTGLQGPTLPPASAWTFVPSGLYVAAAVGWDGRPVLLWRRAELYDQQQYQVVGSPVQPEPCQPTAEPSGVRATFDSAGQHVSQEKAPSQFLESSERAQGSQDRQVDDIGRIRPHDAVADPERTAALILSALHRPMPVTVEFTLKEEPTEGSLDSAMLE